jgi:hypothetical protein
MKRIKPEEIQNSIRNYVIHRNLSANLNINDQTINEPNDQTSTSTSSANKTKNSQFIKNNTVDLSIMALNDLALIESSINDYYSFSFSSNDDKDYLKQFEILKNFVRSEINENNDLEELIFPIFIYLCIDLVSMGFSIKEFVKLV